MAHLTPNERRYIENKLIEGLKTKQDIADDLGCDRKTIYNVINNYLTPIDGSPSTVENRPRTGYSKLWHQEIVELEKYVLNHPFTTNKQIVEQLELQITPRSVSNYLTRLGFGTHVAARKPLINLTNISLRRDWADSHINWSVEQWRTCVFTDESTFQNYASGRQLCKRKLGTRYVHSNIASYESQSRIKRNFFGVMIYGKPVKLFEASDHLDLKEFDQLIKDRVLPYFESQHLVEPIIQMDNATVHADGRERLSKAGYSLLPWCPKMFDISPIENIWGIAKRKKNKLLLNKTISNQNKFDQEMKDLVESIPLDVVNRLFDGMPNRVSLLIESGGRAIRF